MSPPVQAIRFDKVTKSFGDGRVLDGVSFDVPRGSACCIMGRSGTGKSVTLKLLVGLLKPDEGRIYVNDVEIETLDSARLVEVRKTMGFLFQYSALFDSLSVAENVAFPLRRHTRMSESEIAGFVRERLTEVGLEGELDKMPLDLSGGMRKRVGLARALALKPSILLVDEPSSGLDPITTKEIDKLLMNLKASGKTTIVVVTHNVPSARRIGDQLLVLHKGHILAQGTAEELDQSSDEIVQQFMTLATDEAANASPSRSASVIDRSLEIGRSHKKEVEYGVQG
jgi:phospholipid/cholesterol/gamma-HCH transport system ATP-binding protein